MKEYQTTKGQSYIVTSIDECEVKGYLENNTEYLLLTVPANSQGVFVAISDKTVLSDNNSLIIPFADASISVGAGGGTNTGGSRCTIEAVAVYKKTESSYGQTFTYWELDTEARCFAAIEPSMAISDLLTVLKFGGTGEFLYTPLYGFRVAGESSVFLGWKVDVPVADMDIVVNSTESYSSALQSVTGGSLKLFISKYFHE